MSKLKKLASGIGWGAFSTIAVTGFQLMFMAVMARLLEPADFGLVAVANVCLRFFSYFAQMGTAPAIIQKPTLESGDIAAALTVSLGISLLFFILVQAIAPVFEYFYQMPQLGNVIRALSLNFIIGGFSAISTGILQRNTSFKALAIIDVISYVIGYGLVGLTAAYYDYEVWALVAAFMTQMTISAVLSYAVARYPLSFIHTKKQRQHFFSYGGRYSFIGFLEFISSNLDALIIGTLLGAAPAGYYNRAMLLANLPVQQPANILTKALFPILSSLSTQHDKQAISFQLSTLLVGSYAFAISAGIFIAASDIVIVLLGDKWLESIPLLQILSLSVGPIYISHVAGVTLDSMNKLQLKLRIQLSMLIVLIGLLGYLAPKGTALTIATAIVITEWLRLLLLAIKIPQLLSITFKQVIIISCCIFIIGACSAGMIQLVIYLLTFYNNISIIIRLSAEIFAGGLGGLLIGFFLMRYIAIHLSAIQYLIKHSPVFSKAFPKPIQGY